MFFYSSTRFIMCILSASLLDMSTQAEPLHGQQVKRVQYDQYSYVVSIGRKDDRYPEELMHICSGVLITYEFVLTAAHCLNTNMSDTIRVVLGSDDLRKGKKYDVEKWITYDEWADMADIHNTNEISDDNDIAIIKLSKIVRWGVAKPAFVAFQKNNELFNEHFVIAGWGMIDEHSAKPSRYLLEAKVKVLPNAVCENIANTVFKKRLSLSNKYLCTKGEPYVLLGDGDSGAPVFRNNYVVGISRATCPKSGLCDSQVEVINEHKFNVHVCIDFYQEFIDHVLMNY